MKSKFLFSILIIFLILALTGCWEIPYDPDWLRAEWETSSYWHAIINREYDLARCYCIIDGIWYNQVDWWKKYINTNSEGEASVVIRGPVFYKETEVIGDNATVYTRIITDITPFPGSNLDTGDQFEYKIELIREDTPPGDWKLK